MAVAPKIKITIAGTRIKNYVEMVLEQDINAHHYFRVVIKHDDVEDLGAHKLDKSMDWLGKSVLIDMEEYDFTGIVTSVDLVHSHNHFGDIVVSGYSKTILLETAPHKFSWLKKTLKEIVSTLGEAAADLTIINKPKYTETIEYIAQYNESHFDFLKRIAKTYNEILFYDGTNLVFGDLGSTPTIPVVYGKDADSLKIGINIKNVKYDRVSYHSLREEFMDGSTQDSVSGLDELGAHAFNVSKKVFNFNGRSHTAPRIPDKGSLDDDLKKTQSASAADLSIVEGRSKQRGIRPGCIIDLTTEGKKDGSFPSRPYGSYLVISTKHISSSDCNYTNVFKAIPAGVKVLPTPEAKQPLAYSEIARVLSNEDPDKKGRVQVQTQWQEKAEGLSTSWVRVMTPNAGKSELHPKNRGMVFIPEVGDEVMLGYRYGDPSRPYVAGSMFHGMNGKGGDKDNVIKSIITKSGHEITLDDSRGDENIIIKDRYNNFIKLYTAEDNIFISANETISLKAKNIELVAEQNITLDAGEDIEGGASNNIGLSAGNCFNISASKDVVINASKSLIETGAEDVSISSSSGSMLDMDSKGELNIQSNKKVNITSKESQLKGDKKVLLVSSQKAFIEGKSKTVIKGSSVEVS